jgi:hypothetical protein
MSQWFQLSHLQEAFSKFHGRYNDLICPYNLFLGNMRSDMFHINRLAFLDTQILTTVRAAYPVWKWRVWPVDKGCLLLHDTWSHVWYIQRLVYDHSLICMSYTYEIDYCSLFLSFHCIKILVAVQSEGCVVLSVFVCVVVVQMRPENRRHVSQHVWHDKDPSLLRMPRIGENISALYRQRWCLNVNVIRYQFWCCRCAFRYNISLQWW